MLESLTRFGQCSPATAAIMRQSYPMNNDRQDAASHHARDYLP